MLLTRAQGKICDGRCPPGTFLLSQNSQPAGDRTSCRSGSYVPICCQGWSINQAVCPSSSWESTFSGGMAFHNTPDIGYTFAPMDKTTVKRSELEGPDLRQNNTAERDVGLALLPPNPDQSLSDGMDSEHSVSAGAPSRLSKRGSVL